MGAVAEINFDVDLPHDIFMKIRERVCVMSAEVYISTALYTFCVSPCNVSRVFKPFNWDFFLCKIHFLVTQ